MTDADDLHHVTLQHMLWNKYKDNEADDLSTDTSRVEHLRGIAEQAFCSNAYALAARHYRQAASILLNHQVLELQSIQDKKELVNLFSQESECLFRLGDYLGAAELAEEALSIDPNHVPSLYRHAVSNWRGHKPTNKDFSHLFFWTSAAKSFERLRNLDGNYAERVSNAARLQQIATQNSQNDSEPLILFTDSDSEDIIAALTNDKRLPFKKRMSSRTPVTEWTRSDINERQNVVNSKHKQESRKSKNHAKKHDHKKERASEQKRDKREGRARKTGPDSRRQHQSGQNHKRDKRKGSSNTKTNKKDSQKPRKKLIGTEAKQWEGDLEDGKKKLASKRQGDARSRSRDSRQQHHGNKNDRNDVNANIKPNRVSTLNTLERDNLDGKIERMVRFRTDLEYLNPI